MPVFKLSDAERQQIVTTLNEGHSFPKKNDAPQITDELVKQGRTILERARCAACHDLPGPKLTFEPLPEAVAKDWPVSKDRPDCLTRNLIPQSFDRRSAVSILPHSSRRRIPKPVLGPSRCSKPKTASPVTIGMAVAGFRQSRWMCSRPSRSGRGRRPR